MSFNQDYEIGKQSELDSIEDLRILFNAELIHHDHDVFAHFDFSSDNIFVELKTRTDISLIDGKFIFKNNELDSLIFDAVKMRCAYQYNKINKCNKHFYIVWKIKGGRYFYWKINWNKNDYYLKNITNKFGHATERPRDIIYVKTEYIKELI